MALLLVVSLGTVAKAGPPPLPTTMHMVVVATVAGCVGIAVWPRRRITAYVVPPLAIALAALSVWTSWSGLGRREGFQRPEMLRAKTTLQGAVPAGSIVITTEDVGRPMENIEYYGEREALYLTDLQRWRLPITDVAGRMLVDGTRPYLLLPIESEEAEATVRELRDGNFRVDLVVDIPPPRAVDYFVAASFHRGIHMGLWRVGHDFLEDLGRRLRAGHKDG